MDVTAILGKSRLFAGMRAEDVAAFAKAGERRMIVEGEDLFLEGDEDDSMWILLDGRAEAFKHIRGDVDRVLLTLEPGDALGEISFVEGGRRTAGARTLVSSEFLLVTRQSFAEFQRKSVDAAIQFYRNLCAIIASRLAQTTELYRDSIEFGLESLGAAKLDLKSISEELRAVSVHLRSGAAIAGRLLQIDHHAAGYALLVKGADDKTKLIPYHAIEWIELA